MIKPEDVPEEVVKTADKAYDGAWSNKDDPNFALRHAIAAALNAWQTSAHRAIRGYGLDAVGQTYPALILPLGDSK